MASLRGRGFSKRATIGPIAVLAAMLQALLLFFAIGSGHAHRSAAGVGAPAGLDVASADCRAPGHRGEAPPPACPLHPQCCALGSAALSPLDSDVSSVALRVSSGEATTLGFAVEPDARGPEPAPPWSSRAPPSLG
ncbi:hypothetical protein IY145_14380 [Methylosinus sp. H3A]|uniref:hypothetical protein n=1 Tax=Methylosinus sp. H3A TaxID=2785786 RepID=UPI0018C252CD|nr:hypothetical protein [Methylosinus sp. H3A]MBG0810556.1 hypothetical protein [Methylosinus sp. H3A]